MFRYGTHWLMEKGPSVASMYGNSSCSPFPQPIYSSDCTLRNGKITRYFQTIGHSIILTLMSSDQKHPYGSSLRVTVHTGNDRQLDYRHIQEWIWDSGAILWMEFRAVHLVIYLRWRRKGPKVGIHTDSLTVANSLSSQRSEKRKALNIRDKEVWSTGMKLHKWE